MSFKPFKLDKKFFAVVAMTPDGKYNLHGLEGNMAYPVDSKTKVKEGQSVDLEKKDDVWTIVEVTKPVAKTGKGNPVFTPEQMKEFKAMNR